MSQKKAWRAIDTSELIKAPFFKGMYRWVHPLVEKYLGFSKINDIHEAILKIMERDKTSGAHGFFEGCLEHLKADVVIDSALSEALKKIDGPVVVVANHPYGCIDAMSLMRCMQEARPEKGGWKIMANKILRSIESLREVTFAVDPFSKDAGNVSVMKESIRFLKSGGMLGMFPAGRVSAMSDDLGAVCDLPWSEHALKLAKASGAHVVVAHISGENSEDFLAVPTGNASRRAMMLAREIPKKIGEKIKLSYGGTLDPDEVLRIVRKGGKIDQLRARCYAASERGGGENSEPLDFSLTNEVDTESQGENEALNEEIKNLPEDDTLWSSERLSLLLVRGDQAPLLLDQVGRGRAVTFAAIGAGSGNEVDLSPEDQYYHHLVLWSHEEKSLVGSYRIGYTEKVIAEHGVDGLYLNHVFDIDPEFYNHLGPAMELSRSFILPKFQKNPQMLDLLWKGLGLAAERAGCETFFGSVTISASFSALSQSILVETLKKFHSDAPEVCNLVKARVPFKPETKYHPLVAEAWQEDGLNRLDSYIEELEGGQRSIPPLVRYYVSLNSRFLSFHVEPSFNNAVYCLLKVRIKEVPRRYQKRFLRVE